MSTGKPSISEDHRRGARRSARGASACRSRIRSSRGATRRRATTSATTRMASATTIRCGAIRAYAAKTRSAASSRCRASCSRPTASFRATSAACPACMRCGPAPTGTWHAPGAARRRDHDRGVAEGSDRASRRASPAARSSRSITSTSSISTATWSPRRIAGASAPTATSRASTAPNTREVKAKRAAALYARRSSTDVYELYEAEEIRGATPRYLGGRRGRRRSCRRW